MRKILAIALIAAATAVHAQSAQDQVAAERAQAQIEAVDAAQKDAARAAQRAQDVARDREELAERRPDWKLGLVTVVAGVVFLAIRRKNRPKN